MPNILKCSLSTRINQQKFHYWDFFGGGGGLTVSFEQFYICDFRARNPCPNACAAPYGFKNQMSLTKDAKRFSVSICIGYLRKDQIV